jgi:hypothetical protein
MEVIWRNREEWTSLVKEDRLAGGSHSLKGMERIN